MSDTLRRYLKVERGRQERLAEAIDIKPGYLSLIANGHREPTIAVYRKISDATGIPISALINDPYGPRPVPVISMISAGELSTTPEVAPEMILRDVYVSDLPNGDWIAFEVEGSSMNRISPPGSVITDGSRCRSPRCMYRFQRAAGHFSIFTNYPTKQMDLEVR